MTENKYQAYLIIKLETMFPGCEILKNDSSYRQGIPDLVIFYGDRYAMLEVKAYETAPLQPNQDHYVQRFNEMSFAAFIYPENEEVVLNGLQQALCGRRHTRLPKR